MCALTVSGKLLKVPLGKNRGGYIYHPIENCPCAFEPYMSYEDFINHVLKEDTDYMADVRRHSELVTYLCKYSDEFLPCMKPADRNLISFSNGVLDISTREFHLYSDPLPESVEGHVARKHIPLQYTGSTDTPVMDSILRYQFEEGDGQIELLFAMIGRTFFKICERDRWGVVPILLGHGIGKSTIMSIISAMFNSKSVGEIRTNRCMHRVFCNELILIQNLQKKISKVISPDVFEKMVSGEQIRLRMKYKPSIICTWTAPLFMESNVMLDYDDDLTHRRLVVFRFEKSPSRDAIDTTLSKRIIDSELPNIVARSLLGK